MKFQLCNIEFHNTAYHGLLSNHSEATGTVIMVHGTDGNFYEAPFVNQLTDVYAHSGYSVLTANFPGHDEHYIDERFSDFVLALDIWIQAIAPEGPIILQGHSLGAAKILSYATDPRSQFCNRVSRVVLLAPTDFVVLYGSADAAERERRRAIAKDVARSRGIAAPLPDDLGTPWPISARTFLDLSQPGGPADGFVSRENLKEFPWQEVPRLVVLGADDEYAYPSAPEVVNMARRVHNVEAHLIAEAPHAFEGHVAELAELVSAWLERVPST